MAEFWRWTAAELSAAYGAGRADPVAVMAELQARIAALNPQINAYVALADDLATLESSVGLPVPSPPDPGIADMIAGWVEGGSLGAVLDGVLTGGDFVRNVRLVSDLLGQLRKVAPAQVGSAAARAMSSVSCSIASAIPAPKRKCV